MVGRCHHRPRPLCWFLHRYYPALSKIVAREIIAKAQALSEQPYLGHAIAGRDEYRQIVLRVFNTAYVFQYRVERERLVILRVYHGREARE